MPNFNSVDRLQGCENDKKGGLVIMKKADSDKDDAFKKPHSLYTGLFE